MCGINGIIHFHSKVTTEEIDQMNQAISHRGPDDHGVYLDDNIGLGSRRLSILDLSPSGHMPMSSSDGRYTIAFNGEIYNYLEYRQELLRDGVKLKSTGDTEVVLYLYQKYGHGMLEKLRGMFAFAIHDKKKNIIFGARDRFGKKPFKYYIDNNSFIFSSELKAILKNSFIEKHVDYQAIYDYLTYQYVPYPRTGFKNIWKLPPAHYFTLDLNTKELETTEYWRPSYKQQLQLSEKEWCGKIVESLEENVKLRMISDVPLGAFLSGGVDSSAIVGLMAKNSTKKIKTFSIGFKEKDFDETYYAKIVAKKFETEHHELIMKPDTIKDLFELTYFYEEPFGDPSMLPTYHLSKFTSQHVKVALNGDGGDENFAGYNRYTVLKHAMKFEKIPKFIREHGKDIIKLFKNHIYSNNLISKIHRFAESIDSDIVERYMYYICYYTEKEKQDMFLPEIINDHNLQNSSKFLKEIFHQADGKTILDKILYTDSKSYLPDDLLTKVDIATMSQSLEGRSPMLDHTFFDLTSQIPSNLKLKGTETKYIFKKALEDLLPSNILYRKKMGFGLPAGEWFKKELKDYFIENVIENSIFITKIIKKESLKILFDEHLKHGSGEGRKLWLLLCLELWYRNFFTKNK